MYTGVYTHSSWYPGVDGNSSLEQFQRVLAMQGNPDCSDPCFPSTTTTTTATTTTSQECCCVASEGSPCFDEVTWAMTDGVHSHPEWYPGLSSTSTFVEFQQAVYESGGTTCPAPCVIYEPLSSSSFSIASPLSLVFIVVARILC